MKQVERDIVVQSPADTVYQVWRNFENFPNFMENIEEVRVAGHLRSHWKAKAPLGVTAEWDAEITADEPARAIAWRSVDSPDARVRTEGAVRFEALGDATRIRVSMAYEAATGALGDLAATLFADPERQVEQDLRRFKEMIEQPEGYRRSTEEVVGHGTPHTSEHVNRSVDVPPEDVAVQGRYPRSAHTGESRGPGHPEETENGRPITTGTPGGTLGAPTESDLKRDQTQISDRTDTRA